MTSLVQKSSSVPQLGRQTFRFLLAGGLAAFINWLARILLSPFMPFEAAVVLGYAIGMSAGFTLYRAYVFPGSALPIRTQVVRFLAVNALGAVVVLAVALGLVALLSRTGLELGLAEALAHGLAIGVGAVANFLGHRWLTFSRR